MYTVRKSTATYSSLNSGFATSPSDAGGDFYELEPAVVLDVITDETHPIFKARDSKINPKEWPDDINGNESLQSDPDYTWIGRVLVRPLISQQRVEIGRAHV